MSEETLIYIVQRIKQKASKATEETKKDRKDEFKAGRNLAYYEVLDIIKSEIETSGADVKHYGLDMILEEHFI